jgi:uncharacterized protein (DUF1778 family)
MKPAPENPRIASMKLRMTIDEENMLKECASLLGTTKTSVVVTGIKKVYSEVKK